MHKLHGGTPFGRPLRHRSQAMGTKTRSQIAKKYTANGHVRRGRPLTSQTAFGGQLPYKRSLVRPAVRFGHSRSEYRVNTGIHISWQSPQKKRFLLFDDFETSKNGNFEVSLLFYSAIDNMTSIELRSQFAKKYTAHGRTVGASRGKPAREISS